MWCRKGKVKVKGKILNALSFDVEEYFQVSNFEKIIKRESWEKSESRLEIGLNKILSILKEKNVQATFFVLGWTAQRHPLLIKRILDGGNEIATHGYEHKLIYAQSPQEFEADLKKSMAIIESITGVKVLGFRAPSFSVTTDSLWALEVLAKNGLKYDASIFPILHHRYGIENANRFPHRINNENYSIMEYPCSTVRIMGKNIPFSGGGYLRLLPYTLIKKFIYILNKQNKSVMVYLHPWEFDPAQPRIKTNFLNGFRHYFNLESTEKKLRRLLEDFEFTMVKDVLGIYKYCEKR